MARRRFWTFRLQTHSKPEGDGGGEGYAGQEVGGQLVVAGRDAAEVFDTAEGVFDQVAVLVSLAVVADGPLAVAPTRDDRCGPDLTQRATQPVGVVAFVAQQVAHPPGARDQGGRGGHVADVAGRQHQCIRAADDVGERVDLGRPAAARATDRLD